MLVRAEDLAGWSKSAATLASSFAALAANVATSLQWAGAGPEGTVALVQSLPLPLVAAACAALAFLSGTLFGMWLSVSGATARRRARRRQMLVELRAMPKPMLGVLLVLMESDHMPARGKWAGARRALEHDGAITWDGLGSYEMSGRTRGLIASEREAMELLETARPTVESWADELRRD